MLHLSEQKSPLLHGAPARRAQLTQRFGFIRAQLFQGSAFSPDARPCSQPSPPCTPIQSARRPKPYRIKHSLEPNNRGSMPMHRNAFPFATPPPSPVLPSTLKRTGKFPQRHFPPSKCLGKRCACDFPGYKRRNRAADSASTPQGTTPWPSPQRKRPSRHHAGSTTEPRPDDHPSYNNKDNDKNEKGRLKVGPDVSTLLREGRPAAFRDPCPLPINHPNGHPSRLVGGRIHR